MSEAESIHDSEKDKPSGNIFIWILAVIAFVLLKPSEVLRDVAYKRPGGKEWVGRLLAYLVSPLAAISVALSLHSAAALFWCVLAAVCTQLVVFYYGWPVAYLLLVRSSIELWEQANHGWTMLGRWRHAAYKKPIDDEEMALTVFVAAGTALLYTWALFMMSHVIHMPVQLSWVLTLPVLFTLFDRFTQDWLKFGSRGSAGNMSFAVGLTMMGLHVVPKSPFGIYGEIVVSMVTAAGVYYVLLPVAHRIMRPCSGGLFRSAAADVILSGQARLHEQMNNLHNRLCQVQYSVYNIRSKEVSGFDLLWLHAVNLAVALTIGWSALKPLSSTLTAEPLLGMLAGVFAAMLSYLLLGTLLRHCCGSELVGTVLGVWLGAWTVYINWQPSFSQRVAALVLGLLLCSTVVSVVYPLLHHVVRTVFDLVPTPINTLAKVMDVIFEFFRQPVMGLWDAIVVAHKSINARFTSFSKHIKDRTDKI